MNSPYRATAAPLIACNICYGAGVVWAWEEYRMRMGRRPPDRARTAPCDHCDATGCMNGDGRSTWLAEQNRALTMESST